MAPETVNSSAQTSPAPPEPAPSSGPRPPYRFPHDKLKRRQTHPGKTPLVLVACGSFSRKALPPPFPVNCPLALPVSPANA